jgi:hypothetical protein
MPIRKYGNEVFRMKYALLFFSFFFIFILNIDSTVAQAQVNSQKYCDSLAKSTGGPSGSRGYSYAYDNCLKQMGQRATQSGQYTQKYHFDNPQYKQCLTQNGGFGKASEKDIDACMAKSSVKQPAKEVAKVDRKDPAELCKGLGGVEYDASNQMCKCQTGTQPTTINEYGTQRCSSSGGLESQCSSKGGKMKDLGPGQGVVCYCEVTSAEFDPNTSSCSGLSAKDNNCSLKKANYGWDGNDCICGAGQEVDASHYEEVSSGDCRKKGAVAATSKSGEVPSCLQDFKAKAEACKTDGFKAVNSCNKDNKEANAQWSAAQSVIGPMAQIMQMRGQQQGSAETCFQAGALATTTLGAMDLLKETCDNEIEACHNKCEEAEEAYKKVDELCKEEVKNILPPLNKDEIFANMKKEADKLNAELEQGTQACEKDAKTNQARVIDMMNGMNRSAQQAAKCQCQLTAGQTNCDQILGPADCKLTPKDPRCPQAVTIKCAGTDYNTKECLCLRDPKAVSCIGTTGSGVSQVAGFNPVGAGSTSFKTGGTGSGGGLGDFPSDAAVAVSSDKTQGAVDSPFSAASGGGGGGSSGGGGGSDGGGEGGAAEPEAKTGIAGLFNNLKTGVAGLFGGGSKKPTTTDGKNFGGKNGASKNVDPNQWRPVGLRGIAGGNGIGSKNSDIFKTVNNQYNNQYHTLMTLPAEGPK